LLRERSTFARPPSDGFSKARQGEVTLSEIDTSIWGALTIHELSIKYGGAPVVRIPQIQLGYSLIPLLWQEARIEITVVDPAINLQRESDGEWNLMKALASKSPAAARLGYERVYHLSR
jgi:uncharacterized protein involved in outer membrane biogenesis